MQFNREKLQQAEAEFLSMYPDAFDDPGMAAIAKRHKMAQMVEFCQTHFTPDAGSHVDSTISNIAKAVSRSSMVSMFEKPKFKAFLARLDREQKGAFVDALLGLLHGDQEAGFEMMVDLLRLEKLARWSLVSIIPVYHNPSVEVFVKPTTAKGVIQHYEVASLIYKPAPSWAFYAGFRELITAMKAEVDPRLSPTNAAFSGFLMMSLPQ